MFLIFCPHCEEEREEVEFTYCDEAFIERPKNPRELNDKKWANYLFHRNNPKGVCFEQWQHSFGCRKFFILKRNNHNNRILASETFEQIKALQDKEKNESISS